jgi:hypothetical protein
MDRIARLGLSAALALATLAATGQSHRAVTRTAVEMRAAASPRARVLARIPQARTVRVQACARRWCSITYRRARGWVPETSLDQRAAPGRAGCGRGRYRNARGQCTRSPEPAVDGRAPLNSTARCWDGKFSHSAEARGRCSSHGGTPD